MRLSDDWPDFLQKMERAGIRRYNENFELPLDEPRALPAATASMVTAPDAPSIEDAEFEVIE